VSKTSDRFLGGRIELIQPVSGYRAGIDPLFMSAALQPKMQDRILDVGCGVGTAAIALASRCPHVNITGIDIQLDFCELAKINIQKNQLDKKIDIICTDLQSPPDSLKCNPFDHVMTNPPYYEGGRTRVSPLPEKAQSHIETMDLGKWIHGCLNLLKSKGTFTMIHRAERLTEILTHLSDRAGDTVIYPLWPSENKPTKRILVQARKDTRGGLRLSRGMLLHGGEEKYTADAEAVLRHGQGIIL
jgi:tRNA1(Val) A37 N6-methylase TrmN6